LTHAQNSLKLPFAMPQISRKSWNILTFIILFTGALWVRFTAAHFGLGTNGKTPAPHQGFLAPDFTAQSLSGEEVSLSSLKGRPVLVNLWASWCLPCRKEMPALERIYQEYQDEGLTILAVNATSQDQIDKVNAFVKEYRLTFPILLDNNGEIIKAYQISAFPTSFFISADGVIQDVVVGGPMSEALLRSRVEHLLGVSKSEAP
jgi:cytochrome c biogenesis protein CcmG, thiol:disulfide interchange protein DsbE